MTTTLPAALVAELTAASRHLLAAVDAAPPTPAAHVLRSGRVELDLRTRTLTSPRGQAHLGPATCAITSLLLSHPGEPVSRRDLLAALGWHADPCATRRLDTAICRLRRVLPPDLRAVPGYGYTWGPAAHRRTR